MARPRSEPAPAPPSGPLPLQRHCNSCGPSYCNGSIALRISFPAPVRSSNPAERATSATPIGIFDMRQMILALAILYPAAAFAKEPSPPGASSHAGGPARRSAASRWLWSGRRSPADKKSEAPAKA